MSNEKSLHLEISFLFGKDFLDVMRFVCTSSFLKPVSSGLDKVHIW